MDVVKVNRKSDAFYTYLGPVFGSRVIEQETHDRFYDDPDKEWYVLPGKGAASLLGGVIKNFWASDAAAAQALLMAMEPARIRPEGIVPGTHEAVFRTLGFECAAYRKNFLKVHYRGTK